MPKQLLFEASAREKLKRGLDALANVVKVTLGPRGRNVLLDRKFGAPLMTKDGVTVAKEVDLPDPYENLAVRMLREVAEKTSDQAGDGTTSATVLAQAICTEGLKNVAAGTSAMGIKRGLDRGAAMVIEEVKNLSKPVKGKEKLAQVATVSANGDTEVGNLIAEAVDKVGESGVVTVEESKTTKTALEFTEGMNFDRGYISPYFVTDVQHMRAVLREAYILLYEKKISALKDLVPLLEKIARTGGSLLIVAEDVEGEALATMVVNKIRGTLKIAAVKAPGFGDRRKAILEDIAVLTGGKFISEDLGLKLEKVDLNMLGRAQSVTVDKESTTIVAEKPNKSAIQERVRLIRKQIEETTSTYDKEKFQERLAKLASGVCVVNVGAATEVELKEKKARVEDALHATKAAAEEGIVPGGGVALIRAQSALDAAKISDPDERIGIAVLRRALEEPARQIAANAGYNGSLVVENIKSKTGAYGFDADTFEYKDLLSAGIVDPAKVVRIEIENAVSIAGLILTTDCAVAEKPEEKKEEKGRAHAHSHR
ncbi:MAG: chaperonin GroEL [Candidatus Omnitrophica bacterium]|nr:chaperonin GroEL [Candidatus Omnitrophota bacterium]